MEIPLRAPYRMSFVELTELRAVLCRITMEDARVGLGEVVPLPGYSTDTVDSTVATIGELGSQLAGLSGPMARNRVSAAPLSCGRSALQVALAHLARRPGPLRVPVLESVSLASPTLARDVARAAETGFTTVKAKATGEVKRDIEALRALSAVAVSLRVDANQAYTEVEAAAVGEVLHELGAEHFEQPLSADDWVGLERLAARSQVPILLDESIRTPDDIRRAAQIGAERVKLKVYKQGGPDEVLEASRLARDLGLEVVFGNGVATDVVNLVELDLFARHGDLFAGASESVGFAKTPIRLVARELRVVDGEAVYDPPHSSRSNI